MKTSILTTADQIAQASAAGQIVRVGPSADVVSILTTDPARRLERITIGTPVIGTPMIVAIVCAALGLSASVTHTPTTATAATERDALLEALNMDGPTGAIVGRSTQGAASIDLAALAGYDFTVTVSGAGITTATITAAGAVQRFKFGRFYVPILWLAESGVAQPNAAPSGALAGPVLDIDATHDAAGVYDVAAFLQTPAGPIKYVAMAQVNAGADAAATGVLIAAALEAIVAGSVATPTGDDVSWALPVGYAPVSVAVTASGGSAAISWSPSSLTDETPARAWLCYAAKGDIEIDADGNANTDIAGDKGAAMARAGVHMSCEADTAVAYGAPVWVESTPGANEGRPYVAPSPSRYLAPSACWVAVSSTSATLATIEKE